MAELDRIRWRCRRGLLELDLVLAACVERLLPTMTAPEVDVFKALLDRSDNDLWDLINGRLEPAPGPEAQLVARLRGL
jgi:antitoxin CptB